MIFLIIAFEIKLLFPDLGQRPRQNRRLIQHTLLKNISPKPGGSITIATDHDVLKLGFRKISKI